MKYKYKTIIEGGQAMSLQSGIKIHKTVQGTIQRSDGVRVWAGKIYTPDHNSRAKRQADNMRGRFESYQTRIGRCWFDDDRRKRTNVMVDQARGRAKRNILRDAAGDLWRALCGGIATPKTEALQLQIEGQIAAAQQAAEEKVLRDQAHDLKRRRG